MSFPGDRGDHGDHDNHDDHGDHGISLTRADENGDEDQDDLLPKLLKVS